MKKGLGVLLVVAGLIAIVIFTAMGSYNRLVDQREGVDTAWANVLSQYQRRADLVPNLVKTVEGSANFEKSTLESVVNARASVGKISVDGSNPPDEATMQRFQEAQSQFSGALSRLLVVAENYPDLKASAGFRDLQTQIEGTENRIAVERRQFNETAKLYNASVRKFPAVIFAGALGFHPKSYFRADAGAEKAPEVNFEFGK